MDTTAESLRSQTKKLQQLRLIPPASSAAFAGIVMSVMLGVILAHTGLVATALTQVHTWREVRQRRVQAWLWLHAQKICKESGLQ